jgi:group I intron endonuclease
MNGTIYLVTNKLNGKQYVGQTIVARNRIGHGKLVSRAYKKNGYINFTYEPICADIYNRPTLNFIERFWISVMDSQAPNGYNIENGGSNKGKVSEETRKRMSVAFTGRIASEETKAKLRNLRHSAETKAKIAKAMTGRVHSQETIEKIRLGNKGKIVSNTGLKE